MEFVIVGLGGAVGAMLRYAFGSLLPGQHFPWATLAVNGLGSFVLGVALLAVADPGAHLLVGVGFCGAFTTFATFSYQTIDHWERDEELVATLNALGNLFVSTLSFGFAWLLVG